MITYRDKIVGVFIAIFRAPLHLAGYNCRLEDSACARMPANYRILHLDLVHFLDIYFLGLIRLDLHCDLLHGRGVYYLDHGLVGITTAAVR
jgi:hypothetical protein